MKAVAYVVVLLVGIVAGALAFPGSEATRTREDIRNACVYGLVESQTLSQGTVVSGPLPVCEELTEAERTALLTTMGGFYKRMFGVS